MKFFLKIQLVVCFLAFLFTSCNKEEDLIKENTITTELNSKEEETIVKIEHNYEYNGEEFSVVYVLDTEEDEVLEVAGDVEIAEEIFGREDSPEGFLFITPEKGANETSIAIKVFDTNEEVDKYMSETTKGFAEAMTLEGQEAEEIEDAKAKGCNDLSYYGYGHFYFYYNTWFNSEMTGIRRTNKHYYQDWSLGGDNDKMSSLIAIKPYGIRSYMKLYEHSCYGGKRLSFYAPYYYTGVAVPNLSYYRLSGWWWWKKSWNNKTSSYQVLSW